MSARLSGRAKGTRGSVSVTVNRHEELSDRSAPYADFGHGSLFEAAPGPRGFEGTAESPTKSLFMPIEMRKHGGGLHAHFNRRQASPSGAASGLKKSSGSGQAPSHWSNYEPHNEGGPHSKKPHSDYEVFHYEVDPHYEAHSGLRPHSDKIVRCEQWCEIRLIVHI